MLSRLWNIWFYQWAWPAKLVSIAVLVALLIGIVAGVRSWGRSTPKLNEQEIQAGEQAVKDRNDAKLKEILAQSDAREKEITANVAEANAAKVNAMQEARERYENMSRDELQAEFDRRANESK